MADELVESNDTLDSRLGLVVRQISHVHAVERAGAHADHVLLTEAACATRDKKLNYRRGTARCVVSVKILPTATQQCRNYLYKS